MLRRRPLLLSLATLTGVAAIVFSTWPGAQAPTADATTPPAAPPAVVETAFAEAHAGSGTAWVPASVVSRNDARLAGEVPGRLVFVAEVGTLVAAGDAVARIDGETLQLEVREVEALVARQRAELDQATRQYERLHALKDRNLVAASQLDEAHSAMEIGKRELVQAEVARDRARHRADRGTVHAPFAGVVSERLVQVGEYLQPGAPVARLVQTDRIELSARAPASLAADLAPGQSVAVRQGGRTFDSRVRAIVAAADPVSRQVELRLALEDGELMVGSAAEVALPQASSTAAVTVPRDALVLRPEGTFLFRVRDDDTAQRVTVTAGETVGDRVEVIGDVAPGDRLVIRGAERLREGQAVAVRSEARDEAQALAAINTAMTPG